MHEILKKNQEWGLNATPMRLHTDSGLISIFDKKGENVIFTGTPEEVKQYIRRS